MSTEDTTKLSAGGLPPIESEKDENKASLAPPVKTKISDELDATLSLFDGAFEAWLAQLFGPVNYGLTRAFAHHRLKQPLNAEIVFEQLMALGGGKHLDLSAQIEAFRTDMRAKLELYLLKVKR